MAAFSAMPDPACPSRTSPAVTSAERTCASIDVKARSSSMRSGGPAMRVAATGPNVIGIGGAIALPKLTLQKKRFTPAKPDALPSAEIMRVGAPLPTAGSVPPDSASSMHTHSVPANPGSALASPSGGMGGRSSPVSPALEHADARSPAHSAHRSFTRWAGDTRAGYGVGTP